MINTKVKEILLHMGVHKTATSSIQATLASTENEKILAESGWCYPKSWPRNHGVSFRSVFCEDPFAYHVNRTRGYSKEKVVTLNKQSLLDLAKEVALKCPDKLIFSGEGMSCLSHDGLYRLKKYLLQTFCPEEIRVVLYVRDPHKWRTSLIQQVIRAGVSPPSIEGMCLDTKETNVALRVKDIWSVFGKAYTSVFSFEEAIDHPCGPAGHLSSKLLKVQSEDLLLVNKNEGASSVACEIISFVSNKHPFFVKGGVNPKRRDRDVAPLEKVVGPKYMLPRSWRSRLWEKSLDEALWMKENLGINYYDEMAASNTLFARPQRVVMSEETMESIRAAHFTSSIFIGSLIVDCLRDRQFLKGYSASRSTILQLSAELGGQSLAMHRYREKVKMNDDLSQADIYREIALLFESHGDTPSALASMELASAKLDGQSPAMHRYREKVMMNDDLSRADIYREIALLFESHGDITSALASMRLAYRNRYGPFICEKIKEYEKALRDSGPIGGII
jgi:hypothetical protein